MRCAGPMSPRIGGTPGYHIRQGSEDIDDKGTGQKRLLADADQRYIGTRLVNCRDKLNACNSSKSGPNTQDAEASPLSESSS